MLPVLTIVLAIAFSISNVPPPAPNVTTPGHIETPAAIDPPENTGGGK